MEKADESCTAKFDSERPAVWDIPLSARADDDQAGLKFYENCGMDSCTVDVGECTVAPRGVKDIVLSSIVCVSVSILSKYDTRHGDPNYDLILNTKIRSGCFHLTA